MEDKKMMELADQLADLKLQKTDVQEQLKSIDGEIEAVESALIETMTSQECTGFKHGGKTFSLVIKEFPGAVPESKQELYDAMKQHGFEHLFTINAMTLSGTVKELKANNDDILPDWLEGLIQIFEKPSIRVAKSK